MYEVKDKNSFNRILENNEQHSQIIALVHQYFIKYLTIQISLTATHSHAIPQPFMREEN